MTTRTAVIGDAIVITRMLETALRSGWEGKFPINRRKLLDHVVETIKSFDGFAEVLLDDQGSVIGCFCGECTPHAYCNGNVASELGSFIMPENRGNKLFAQLFSAFLKWTKNRPDVLFTTFSIGQLGDTTPYLRKILKEYGFTKSTEGFYKCQD